jgi:glycosyltransferase involved in cell wall biosynthesis
MLKLSVLIPARNEVAAIQDCLHSVLAQDYPKNCIEIIVADNGSTDGTMAAVKQLGIHCYLSAAKNISILRNELASMATGDIFVYLDADCIVDEYWASSGVSLIESNTKIGAVGGYIRKPENSHWLIDGWALRMHEVSASVDALPTGTFFISRAVFNDMRGFDNCLVAGEDSELSHRLINAGYVLQRTPKTSAVHLGYPDTVKGFCSRQIWQTRDYLSTNSGIKDMVFMLVNITLVFFCALYCIFSLY